MSRPDVVDPWTAAWMADIDRYIAWLNSRGPLPQRPRSHRCPRHPSQWIEDCGYCARLIAEREWGR